MSDYIKREDVLAVIYGQHIGGKEACENARPNTFGADLREIASDIEDIPAADVVERGVMEQYRYERDVAEKQLAEIGKCIGEQMDDVVERKMGEWIEDDDGYQICSECGAEHHWCDYRASFCEDCGAEMRNGGENDD